ncbi:flagellar transcriptional regulator FlhD [Methylococcus sp. EFPC2]|uniref:flagellar transcriptional regulator FlhD n=1 Tax=Methylococcus sp. EFPC2 TaxID=2812648 RepID=UPI00196712BB|nr:flagellar transcriptional regulator FlhD [Methylococcus sp. EFPC2]QSA98127.1 flagellar transcriptional regulator FlhD [Methylococcus sp. EFPC2]
MNIDLDLYELNLFYLLKAREMALKGQSQTASLVMGISQDNVKRLPGLSFEKIRALARSGALCYTSRLPDKLWKEFENTEMDEELVRARVLLMIAAEGQGHDDDHGAA